MALTTTTITRATAAEFTASNSILPVDTQGYETDTGEWKAGDGTTHWNDLSYAVDYNVLTSGVVDIADVDRKISSERTPAGLVIDGKIVAERATERAHQSSTFALTNGPRPVYLDAYNKFFGGAAGAHPDARWVNTSHLTPAGLAAWAAFVVDGRKPDGTYAITGTDPKVVWFGDSWTSQDPPVLAAAVTARIPGAVVVNVGVGGDTSSAMLARFDAAVPADADFVIINEPGVNDIYQKFTPATVALNLETLVAKIRALGAVPIITGMVPLVEYPVTSAARSRELLTQADDGSVFPALTATAVNTRTAPSWEPNTTSVGVGTNALALVTGAANTAIGTSAGSQLTTADSCTIIGKQAAYQNAVGIAVTAVGAASLASTTAAEGTALGANSLVLATTGGANTAVGKDACYIVNGSAAKATTTGARQTAIGFQAGCSPTGDESTAVGTKAEAKTTYSTALGARTLANGWGAVAIGVDSTGLGASTAGNDEFALGTATHLVKVKGRLTIAPRTPTSGADTQGAVGDITSDDSYVYAKTSTGWKRAALTTW